MKTDHTHDSKLTSWIESANDASCDFPIQNLPFCVFSDPSGRHTVGVGIGDQILNLREISTAGVLGVDAEIQTAMQADALNALMALPAASRTGLRHALSALLAESTPTLRDQQALRDRALCDREHATYHVPAQIRDYSDFYASVYHATNVGCMFRPDNPLLPNYKWIPVGYHGRASSIVVSGHPVRRPTGQKTPEPGQAPPVKPCALLDYELEVAIWVAEGNPLGTHVSMDAAESHLFGLSLLNDWSARDLQKWEYQPLGPFLAKSFATTVAAWVVTMDALAPFRCRALARPTDDPQPLPHLDSAENREFGGVDITLEVYLASDEMRTANTPRQRLSRGNFRDLYWTPAQMLVHHTSNGCNLAPGDLLGSGTVSGPERESRGCLLELTWDGERGLVVPGTQRTPIELPDGNQRTFLADGDEVALVGYCQRSGFRRIGFGECSGVILPA